MTFIYTCPHHCDIETSGEGEEGKKKTVSRVTVNSLF